MPDQQAAPGKRVCALSPAPTHVPCHHLCSRRRRRGPADAGGDHTGWMRGQLFLASRQQRGASCWACLRLGGGRTPHMPEAPIRFRYLNTHSRACAPVSRSLSSSRRFFPHFPAAARPSAGVWKFWVRQSLTRGTRYQIETRSLLRKDGLVSPLWHNAASGQGWTSLGLSLHI